MKREGEELVMKSASQETSVCVCTVCVFECVCTVCVCVRCATFMLIEAMPLLGYVSREKCIEKVPKRRR